MNNYNFYKSGEQKERKKIKKMRGGYECEGDRERVK